MPEVYVHAVEGRTPAQKKALMKDITDAVVKNFGTPADAVVVTSQVLNEGVDVPAASVGIILSGTGSVREHVQRLGRLLRKHGEKQALLYEVVARGIAQSARLLDDPGRCEPAASDQQIGSAFSHVTGAGP